MKAAGVTGLAWVAAAAVVAACDAPGVPGGAAKAPPPPPPPTADRTPARITGALYAVEATAKGQGVWRYAVTVKGKAGAPARFDALRFRTSTDLSKCKLSLANSQPASGIAVTNPGVTGLRADFQPTAATPSDATGWTAATFELACDHRGGTLSLVLTDLGEKLDERVVVGPVIGPDR